MQFTDGFAVIPDFFFSGLFPTFFFSCHCLNYVPKRGNNLCICKACEHSALLCQMETHVFTFSVFSMVPDNASLTVPSFKLQSVQ